VFCPHCGSEIKDEEAEFCSRCGNILKKPLPESKSFIRKIPGFRSGKWWKMLLAILGYGFIILLILGAISPDTSPSISNIETNPRSMDQTSKITSSEATINFDLNKIAGIGLPIHNHWTDKDINDGKIVYIDLVNTRNEAISFRDADINGLTVKLRVLGLDPNTKDFTIELFSRTYPNLNYDDITYPQGQNPIVIFYDDISNYENDCCTAISAEVKLPDGRVLKTHDLYDFDVKPTVVQ
jgi:hypothetical protein